MRPSVLRPFYATMRNGPVRVRVVRGGGGHDAIAPREADQRGHRLAWRGVRLRDHPRPAGAGGCAAVRAAAAAVISRHLRACASPTVVGGYLLARYARCKALKSY